MNSAISVAELVPRWFCGCGWRGGLTDFLRAPDPFNPGDELTACPNCRQQDELQAACEQLDCWKEATCGGTFSDGVYRRTCGTHATWIGKRG